jgi:hypothetical protein
MEEIHWTDNFAICWVNCLSLSLMQGDLARCNQAVLCKQSEARPCNFNFWQRWHLCCVMHFFTLAQLGNGYMLSTKLNKLANFASRQLFLNFCERNATSICIRNPDAFSVKMAGAVATLSTTGMQPLNHSSLAARSSHSSLASGERRRIHQARLHRSKHSWRSI